MMDRGEPLDRVLKRRYRPGHDVPPPGGCLDAETIAAWTDGALTREERAAAEAHAADCDRCLAIVADLARAVPPQVETPVRWLPVRWLVPLATAAAAVTVWVLLRPPQGILAPSSSAPVQQTAEAVKPAGPPVNSERDESLRPPKEEAAGAPAGVLERSADARRRDQAAPAESTEALSKQTEPEARQDAKPEAPAAPAFPTPAPPLPPAAGAAPSERQEIRSEAPAPRAAVPAPATGPRPTVLPQREVLADSAKARAFSIMELEPFEIVSPDPGVRWRVAGTRVEHSRDGGRTWRAQAADAGSRILSGSSPSPGVCWLAGRQGVVLQTTDGTTWRRLDFPDSSADLIRIVAQDAARATVTDANGRTFQTIDGGRTWTLQENTPAPF